MSSSYYLVLPGLKSHIHDAHSDTLSANPEAVCKISITEVTLCGSSDSKTTVPTAWHDRVLCLSTELWQKYS